MKITTATTPITQSKPQLLIVPVPSTAPGGAPQPPSRGKNKSRTKTSASTLTLETLGIESSLLKELCHLDPAAEEQLEEGVSRLELTQIKEGQRFDLPLYLTNEKRAVTVRFVSLPTTTNLHGWRKMGGDALLAANNKPLKTPKDLEDLIALSLKEGKENIALSIGRGETTTLLPIEIKPE
jgi:hypothetical protein